MSIEKLGDFGTEAFFIGGLNAGHVGPKTGKVDVLTDNAIIGDQEFKVGAGNRMNLLVFYNLKGPVLPTWFGFSMLWTLGDMLRDDESVWPNGVPYGAPPYSYHNISSFLPGRTNLVSASLVADSGGFNCKEYQLDWTVVNLMALRNAAPPGGIFSNAIMPVVAPMDRVTFYFSVEPAIYVFAPEDCIYLYALLGAGSQ